MPPASGLSTGESAERGRDGEGCGGQREGKQPALRWEDVGISGRQRTPGQGWTCCQAGAVCAPSWAPETRWLGVPLDQMKETKSPRPGLWEGLLLGPSDPYPFLHTCH